MVYFLLALLTQVFPLASWAKDRHVCTITINSDDEKKVFQKHLPAKNFSFVELIEKSEVNSTPSETVDWFAKACQTAKARNLKCDALIISGHFAGTFFGSSERSLSLEMLEKAACSNACDGILKHPKAVYLFGCNTLASRETDNRSPEEYLQILLDDGIPREYAEVVVESRYGSIGQTNRDRMLRVFGNSPRIYGFNSVGPSGANVKAMLLNYFKQNPDFEKELSKLEEEQNTKDVKALFKKFNSINNKTNDSFQACLKSTNVVCANGICEEDEEISNLLCFLRDPKISQLDRLLLVEELLKRSDMLAFVSTVQEVLGDKTTKPRQMTQKEAEVFKRIKGNAKLKSVLTNILSGKSALLVTQRIKWAQFAKDMNWITTAEYQKQLRLVAIQLGKNLDRVEDSDLFWSLYIGNQAFQDVVAQNHQIHEVLAPNLKSKNVYVRGRVLDYLSHVESTDPKIHAAVAALLKDENYEVRADASKALEKLKVKDRQIHLSVASLLVDENIYVRKKAVEALGELSPTDTNVQKALIASLDDKDHGVQSLTAESLVKMKLEDPKILEALAQKAVQHPNSFIRYLLVQALGQTSSQNSKVYEVLVSLSTKDTEKNVRDAASAALKKMNAPQN
jgi:hypothetical protein